MFQSTTELRRVTVVWNRSLPRTPSQSSRYRCRKCPLLFRYCRIFHIVLQVGDLFSTVSFTKFNKALLIMLALMRTCLVEAGDEEQKGNFNLVKLLIPSHQSHETLLTDYKTPIPLAQGKLIIITALKINYETIFCSVESKKSSIHEDSSEWSYNGEYSYFFNNCFSIEDLLSCTYRSRRLDGRF